MPDIVADLAWTADAVRAGRAALRAGAPILVDATMVAAGIRRSALSGRQPDPLHPAGRCHQPHAHSAMATTRSAAAVDGWRERLDGAVVAIGNAPTALFRLLELLADGAPRPALVLGFPVGFIGAAEAKQALIAYRPHAAPHRAARSPRRQRHGGRRPQCPAGRRFVARPAVISAPPGEPWLSVVGIGDDGLASLCPAARAVVEAGEVLVGGKRQLAMVAQAGAEQLAWRRPLETTFDDLEARRGRKVVVLASGDPMCFGVGETLARRFAPNEMQVLPAPSAFSLVCARLGWSRTEVEGLSLHARPADILRRYISPGARLIVLSHDGQTPNLIAAMLCEQGYGPSRMTVFEHLGGSAERRIDGSAEAWPATGFAALNTVAIACAAGAGAALWPCIPGLPDEAFESDGMLTRRDVRAATLARLAPLAGQTLWDVGAGSGAVAIEWLRALRRGHAVAIEHDPERCASDRAQRPAPRHARSWSWYGERRPPPWRACRNPMRCSSAAA